MNREDFPMLQNNIIYFDSGATTFKPHYVIDSIVDYYSNYSANAHRGDYNISFKVDEEYENTREVIRKFINAKSSNEIVFTSGTTDSLNKIIFGYFKDKLGNGDEVLITKSEHASNVLPWMELADTNNLKLKYINLDENLFLTIENVKKSITPKTKVISIAHITNVVGDVRPLKEIIAYAHSKNINVVVDGAQSVPHIKTDVQDLDIDFLAFSGHKMLGPTGIGVLYAKENFMREIKPIIFGGGMNTSFSSNGVRIYKDIPHILEAGTPNIAGVIGLKQAIEYINNVGIDTIKKHEKELKTYLITRLKEVKDIEVYNEKSESGIVTFNIKDIFAEDLAIYLNKYNICVRAGNHCAKVLKEEMNIKNTCRISFYLYNTKEEIDRLIEVLKNPNLKNEII